MRISDWSSDVCSSDLEVDVLTRRPPEGVLQDSLAHVLAVDEVHERLRRVGIRTALDDRDAFHQRHRAVARIDHLHRRTVLGPEISGIFERDAERIFAVADALEHQRRLARSEEHTSELQSLMRISYAVFCLKK